MAWWAASGRGTVIVAGRSTRSLDGTLMGTIAQRTTRLAITLVICYVYGLLALAIYLGIRSIFVQNLPEWPLWQYVVTPLAVGLFELAGERWLRPSARFREWNSGVPQWKKGVFLILLVLGGFGLVVLIR